MTGEEEVKKTPFTAHTVAGLVLNTPHKLSLLWDIGDLTGRCYYPLTK